MKQQTAAFSKAASRLTCTNIFFTSLLYSLKIEAREDLPAAAATDGVHLYYHPKLFAEDFTEPERVFVLVHELLHVILFHSLRRGIRDPMRWNIACDHAVNLLCVEYEFTKPKDCFCDTQYKGMTAEQIYDKLTQEEKEGGKGKGQDGLAGDVMDYDPSQNGGITKADVERATAIATECAMQAAKAAGLDSAGMKRMIGNAQVEREPWYEHLRRYITSMHARQYNWARIDSRRAVLHGVISPQQKSEAMGKIVFGVDCSGSITERQLSAMGAHVTDLLKDVTPDSVIVVFFDSVISHVDEYQGPDYHIQLEPHGGGGTAFEPVINYVVEQHPETQVLIMLTDMFGSMDVDVPAFDVLWVTQTENQTPPFGEIIYADFNEN